MITLMKTMRTWNKMAMKMKEMNRFKTYSIEMKSKVRKVWLKDKMMTLQR